MGIRSELDNNIYHIKVRNDAYDYDTVRIEFLDGPLQHYTFDVDIRYSIREKEEIV